MRSSVESRSEPWQKQISPNGIQERSVQLTLDIDLDFEVPRAPRFKKAFALVSPVYEFLIFGPQIAENAFEGLPIDCTPKAAICG